MKKTMRLRVLSYNIHQGLTAYRRRLALSLLKDAIKSLKADVVLLQEVAGVHGGKKRRGKDPLPEVVSSYQLEALADEIWPYHAYGRNSVFSGGFHGNAILSRYPIIKSKNIDISIKNMIRRGMLHARIALENPEIELDIIGTHFGLLQYERQKQLRGMIQYIQNEIQSDSRLIIGGDFNDWRERISPRLARSLKIDEAFMRLHRRHARSFPANFPVLRLDRIYFRHLKAQAAERLRGRPWLLLSDHLPLLAEFSL